MVAMLELIWGEGYMAPGGPGNVARLLDGIETRGKRILDVGCGIGGPALEMIETFQPHVVLIDVLMPGKSGLDLLVSLRRDRRWADTPVVMITGNDKVLEDDCRSYLATRGDVRFPEGVLGKPIDRDALLDLLSRLSPIRNAVDAIE